MSATIDQVKPAAGYVIVAPDSIPDEVDGIIQPKKNQEIAQWGKIVLVGAPIVKEGTTYEFDGKVGQAVIYKRWGGNEVTIESKKYYFLKFDEIIGVVA